MAVSDFVHYCAADAHVYPCLLAQTSPEAGEMTSGAARLEVIFENDRAAER